MIDSSIKNELLTFLQNTREDSIKMENQNQVTTIIKGEKKTGGTNHVFFVCKTGNL